METIFLNVKKSSPFPKTANGRLADNPSQAASLLAAGPEEEEDEGVIKQRMAVKFEALRRELADM